MKRFAFLLTAVCALTLAAGPAWATELCLFDGNLFGLMIPAKTRVSRSCNFVLPHVDGGNCRMKEINAVDSVFNRHSSVFAHKVACSTVPVP
jgi:hypothetical protein